MIRHYKPAFLIMSENDEKSLQLHKNSYKGYQQKYMIAAFCLKTFGHDFAFWREAFGGYQYYCDHFRMKKQDSFDSLMKDLMCVFILDACVSTMRLVMQGQAEQAANIFACMSIGCHQFLEHNHGVYKQALKYGDRIISGVKRSKSCAQLKNAFEVSLKKIK